MASNRGVDRFSIDVRLYPHGFAKQLPESNFVREGANWLVARRHDMREPAKPIYSPHWLGVRGTAIVGCFAEEGGYVGLCQSETALVGTAKRSADLFAAPESNAQFEIILGSLRFLP